MDELIIKIQNDPVLMLAAAIGVVILLFVVLVVVVAAMRIRTYKHRFINVDIDNREKEQTIASLQAEVDALRKDNTKQASQLEAFAKTRATLEETQAMLDTLRKEFTDLQSLQKQTRTELENVTRQLSQLQEEYASYRLQMESTIEENNKLRVNNARLLMKLESEERFAQQLKQRQEGEGS